MSAQKKPTKQNQRQESAEQEEPVVDAAYTDPPTEEVSYEALDEALHGADADLAAEEVYDTQATDGSTYNPHTAEEQGLVYTPPHDPPVLPSDDLQGAEVAAGFAPSMEDSDPAADADLQEEVETALRYNSETSTLEDIQVYARAGVVVLSGSVPNRDDAAFAEEIVAHLDNVRNVVNRLNVTGAA